MPTIGQFFIFALALIASLLVGLKIYLKYKIRYCKSNAKLHDKVIIVTGGTSGIGYETVKNLAQRGARIILAARDLVKAEQVVKELQRETKNTAIAIKHLDLSQLSSVRQFCTEINNEEPRLDLLINNAGVVVVTQCVTSEGFETHYVSNYLGHWLLTNLLLDLMTKTSRDSPTPAKIINVSSTAHTWPSELDLQNRNSALLYDKSLIYPLTKLYNVLFTVQLDKLLRISDTNIVVNAVHPGVVYTDLFRDAQSLIIWKMILKVAGNFFRSPWEGAQTTLHVALDDEGLVSGKYFDNCQLGKMSPLASDKKILEELWELSKQDTELTDDEDYFGKKIAD